MRDGHGITATFVTVFGLALVIVSCGASVAQSPGQQCDPFEQLAAQGTKLELPTTDSLMDAGHTALVGYVADSLTGRAIRNALVRLHTIGDEGSDSASTMSDAHGGFALGHLRRGLQRYEILSPNFQRSRGVISLEHDVDTLRIRLTRGTGLCSVSF